MGTSKRKRKKRGGFVIAPLNNDFDIRHEALSASIAELGKINRSGLSKEQVETLDRYLQRAKYNLARAFGYKEGNRELALVYLGKAESDVDLCKSCFVSLVGGR